MKGTIVMNRLFLIRIFILALFCTALLCISTAGQTQITAFTYQGRFTDSTAPQPTSGAYDFQFALFDAATGGAQQGALQTISGVQVANGTFTVRLDFGTSAFPGADRFLEISVKKPADVSYTPLSPRQQLTSSPYAVQTINATKLGGVAANQYVQTSDSRLTDARTPAAGSANYIQNRTTQQSSASFNISGSGTVGGAFTANTVTSDSASNLAFTGQSSSNVGTWLRLNNTSTGGHNWNLVSTGSGNGEGAGKLLFNDQTSGSTRMQLDSTGATVAGNLTAGNLNASGATIAGNLTVSGTINASFPNCKARQTSPQLFANNNSAVVRLDDSPSCSGVTLDNPNEQLVIDTPGLYQITGEILFTANGNGFRWLSVTSSQGEAAFTSINALNGYTTGLNASALVRLNAGDRVYMIAMQTSGDSLFADVFGGRSASLSVVRVAP